jgi:ABC-type phosphate transport system auxiliary subunit
MTLTEIRNDNEQAEERRRQLWHALSEGHDQTAAAELAELNSRLENLWNDYRAVRARIRFGDPETIVKRARLEERLERAA